MDKLEIRALEGASQDGPPESRGFAMLAAFSQSSANDATMLNQKIIAGFGYTTMDPSSGKFLNIRTFADV